MCLAAVKSAKEDKFNSIPTSLFTFGSIPGDPQHIKTDYACSDTVSNKL